ncbi:hypothetical protein CGLO_11770 [Colletotrichum gloeosporioides Cg-14]|uniref:Uncharacterized protein n=1 Tax=Colletotrichum gloeosporioides (strain Cg-14) TaxID=1237896 RepID=T0LL27_COLGC|nr:hypothetical protein CGLO_11770 [Colletotrichum gloeosporioides Cg-14]
MVVLLLQLDDAVVGVGASPPDMVSSPE